MFCLLLRLNHFILPLKPGLGWGEGGELGDWRRGDWGGGGGGQGGLSYKVDGVDHRKFERNTYKASEIKTRFMGVARIYNYP